MKKMALTRFLIYLQFSKLNLSISVDLKPKTVRDFQIGTIIDIFSKRDEFLKDVNGPCCDTSEFSVECRNIRSALVT